MNYTQNEKIMSITESTLVIGIDIAKQFQYARAFDYRGIELSKVKSFENTAEGFKSFDEWLKLVAKENKKDNIIVGLEPTGHYWFTLGNFLKELGIKLVLVNPFHVKRSKELDDNSQTKNDLKDPKTIAKLVIEGRYSQPYIPEGIYSELRIAMGMRESLTKNLSIIKNKVDHWLDKYFPEFNDVFANWEGKAALMSLTEFSTPEQVLSTGVQQIVVTWKKEVKRAVGIQRAVRLVEAAKISIGIKEGIKMAKKELEANLEQYELYLKQNVQLEIEIEELAFQVPGVKEMVSMKGVGVMTAAGFIAEVGDIKRFTHPRQIQKLAGLNLIESSSGKHKGKTSISKRGRVRLRALLFRVMMPLVSKNNEFKVLHEYYTNRKENPLKKKQSLILLCCKLIRIFFTIITKKVEYNPQKLMKDTGFNLQLKVA
ncbi:IS110 family transposase [Clostridium tagluense]|uniref:IS110 family transposase n=1 Tax=Clostridium tagluense TaxID=360422 RepID=UPI001C0D7AC0|nr:IS110 family transposase [Clostridium tagluense]MBU3130789.1 IS110 family transposase [Clostridium tagluense]MCB2314319.1 IS110 family transposase [Clostridium tagluense]MCB2319168.1 IS110 family transposase [Clostridium tagluense]MCB2324064.1 IS110 family transposase [Clostridium tagluense]MCB2328913.1 IS110 family transposase [Clostridium tagluense]